ncbi:MAG: ATP-binding protein [Desulfopila sp.]|jgi:signal transduction histidine kinase|nr:ATP-binding protein [Desulfopila sp.]
MQLSLQKKFIIVAFFSLLALTASISTIVALQTKTALYTASEKQGKMLAQTVSALIVNELIYEMLGLVEEGGLIDNYVRGLIDNEELDLNFVAVLDTSGRVISHSDFSEYGKRYDDDFLQQTDGTTQVRVRNVPGRGAAENSMEFSIALSIEGKRWGMLYFSLSLQEVEEKIREILLRIISISGIALVLLFIFIYFLSRRFIKPIIDLSHAMAEVEVEMRVKEIPVSGNDELSQLTKSFNEMVNRIRRANERMGIAHEKLLQSEKLATLGVLSSSIAHRINNPLGGLFNCVSMLRRKGDETDFRNSYLDLIEEGLESIKDTIGQLLNTAGRGKGQEQRSNVALVLANIMKFLDYRLKRQGISYSAAIEPGLVAPVAPHDLEEIFLNTIINAIQAMKNGGELRVTAARKNEKIYIEIEDNGSGIDKDDLEKVFDLYYTTKEPEEGTGVGLWMAYELAQKYKGDILLESSAGEGTKVSFIIPEGR